MRRFVRSLSDRAELWLVVVLAFGYFIVASLASFFTHRLLPFTDRGLFGTVLFEIGALSIVAWMARVRGWSPSSRRA